MAADGERQREEARELAKYEEDCKDFKVSTYLIAMLIAVSLAFLVTSFLVPRTPQWYRTYFLQCAVLFFLDAAFGFCLITRRFGWFALPKRPDVEGQPRGEDKPDLEIQLGAVEATGADRFCPV
ncbi:hypothetical protein CFC21_025781 [Triticum aestivum]|uniref:Transmembrane protein n=2 Tax=Triticum aestivum TaxID=4565 RepID=A0A9R1JBK1_WHEAT|nr:hypothetical protein CFC21_025780 [Triticum aestivum]KAF7011470.1 hypothetical protein CFC21_025781 [Triticum aestivum]